jgi:hypothetical protein
MFYNYNVRRPRLAWLSVLVLLLALLFPVIPTTPAHAASNNVQYNLWGRGGNHGYLFSANFLWSSTSVYAYITGNWPFAVSVNEMCRDNDNPNITSQ